MHVILTHLASKCLRHNHVPEVIKLLLPWIAFTVADVFLIKRNLTLGYEFQEYLL
jgi:hypothetical protein